MAEWLGTHDMARETILIVDSDSASLKMAAAVLRREGFTVQLASNGEQALSMLRTGTADLLLVNITLPGITGLELTYRLKQNPRTREMIVIALLPSVTPDAERAVYGAGCEGYLVKPLDPLELTQRVREFLNPSVAEPEGSGASEIAAGLTLSGPEVEDLRRTFASDGARQSRVLLDSLESGFDVLSALETTRGWTSAALALNFEDVAESARASARMLSAHPGQTSKVRPALTALAEAFEQAAAKMEAPLPANAARWLDKKRIALIGFAEREAERMCAALERAGALVRMCDAAEPLDSQVADGCSLVLVHVRPETARSQWLTPAGAQTRPLVLVGRGEALMALDPAVQRDAREFLIDGWQPEEVVIRLGVMLSRLAPPIAPADGAAPALQPETPVPPPSGGGNGEILLVDDDLSIRALVQAVFEKHGMKCRLAANGVEGIDMIWEHRPAAVLLDINMPGIDGFEVLSRIRASLPGIRVIMFTANERESDIVRGFELGADDYIVKPFRSKELVARVKRLL
jgi:DNA-binding response OmpR family regulator